MATPGELVAAIAEAFKLPLSTIVEHDRNLVTAGLRTKGGRGRSAAQTTSRDAARLLVAVLASEVIRESVHSVRRYEATQANASRSSTRLFTGCGIKELERLPKTHSFVDAVEALVTALTTGTLVPLISDDRRDPAAAPSSAVASIEIGALSPGTLAEIRIAGVPRRSVCSVSYLLPDPFTGNRTPSTAELRAWEARMKEFRVDSYVEAYRRIKEKGLLRLAARLKS